MIVLVTKHCLRRIEERCRIFGLEEELGLIRRMLEEGVLVDRRPRHLLIKYRDMYLLLRESRRGLVAITVTRRTPPPGFVERMRARPPRVREVRLARERGGAFP